MANDYLTGFTETKSVPRGTAEEVARFLLENIALRHDAPLIVITVTGTAFTFRVMKTVISLSGTCHRKAMAYHPQTRGLTERLNKTIACMLCMCVGVDHKNWDTILPCVTFAYNAAQQVTTRVKPVRLIYRRDVSAFLDTMLPHTRDDPDGAAEFTQRTDEARQLARVRIRNQQRYDASRCNLLRRQADYHHGDMVCVCVGACSSTRAL